MLFSKHITIPFSFWLLSVILGMLLMRLQSEIFGGRSIEYEIQYISSVPLATIGMFVFWLLTLPVIIKLGLKINWLPNTDSNGIGQVFAITFLLLDLLVWGIFLYLLPILFHIFSPLVRVYFSLLVCEKMCIQGPKIWWLSNTVQTCLSNIKVRKNSDQNRYGRVR